MIPLEIVRPKVSATRLTEGVHLLPYQETQTFKDVLREFRSKVTSEPMSQRAGECKHLKQLFPPESEDRGTTSKFDKVVNRLEVKLRLRHAREKLHKKVGASIIIVT